MPYTIRKLKSGLMKVTSPSGTKAKRTTLRKAKAQIRLLHGIENGWRPTHSKRKPTT